MGPWVTPMRFAGGDVLIAQRSALDPRLLWATLALVGAVLLGALVIFWLDRWRKAPVETKPSANDQLAAFRALYERGGMSQEEFERVKARLTEQLRQEMEVPATPAAPPVPQSGDGPAKGPA